MEGFFHGQLVRLLQFLSARQTLPASEVGGAHAPSPDVRYGPPGLHSLGGVCAPPSMAPLVAYAGSQGMGTPSPDHPDSAREHALDGPSSCRHRDRVFQESGQFSGTPAGQGHR